MKYEINTIGRIFDLYKTCGISDMIITIGRRFLICIKHVKYVIITIDRTFLMNSKHVVSLFDKKQTYAI